MPSNHNTIAIRHNITTRKHITLSAKYYMIFQTDIITSEEHSIIITKEMTLSAKNYIIIRTDIVISADN